jgi:hypothetical protein
MQAGPARHAFWQRETTDNAAAGSPGEGSAWV